MSKITQVLVQMASDAVLVNQDSLTNMLVLAEISQAQKEAIIAKDINALRDSIHDLPNTKCFPIVLPEEEETSILSQLIVNF